MGTVIRDNQEFFNIKPTWLRNGNLALGFVLLATAMLANSSIWLILAAALAFIAGLSKNRGVTLTIDFFLGLVLIMGSGAVVAMYFLLD